MYVTRVGQPLPRRGLAALLEEQHEDRRAEILATIARRQAAGTPLDDGDGPLEDPGPLDLSEEVGDLEIVVRTVSTSVYEDTTVRHVEALRRLRASLGSEEGEREYHLADEEIARVMGDYVLQAVAEIHGLEDDDGPIGMGPLTQDDVETLRAAQILHLVYTAARYVQRVTGAKKKLCGLRPRSTSPTEGSLTVTYVPLDEDSDRAAEAARRWSGSGGPSTRPTRAPVDTGLSTTTSAPRPRSTSTPGESSA